MTTAELAKRAARADREIFVIRRTEDGFSIYAAENPKRQYVVSEDEDGPHCTCPDFESHDSDSEWRCKHILAVFRHGSGNGQALDPFETQERGATPVAGREPRKRKTMMPPVVAHIVLKRSVSPDGRIDSLSVELATPVSDITADAITPRAQTMLAIQSEIVDQFLQRAPKPNGATPNGNGRSAEDAKSPASPARVVGCGGMDGKWGRRLFLTVEADGKRLRLYGNRKQLGEQLLMAGYPDVAQTFTEGQTLDLPCRVITKPSPDGGYVNVERLLPVRP